MVVILHQCNVIKRVRLTYCLDALYDLSSRLKVTTIKIEAFLYVMNIRHVFWLWYEKVDGTGNTSN